MGEDKRWTNQTDPGILRNKPDILVFGYTCTLFRDDQKALEMDQGKHLIPWNGVESLKIDRYDARGLLSELSQFEGTSYDYVPTTKEREFEKMCDEERYRALEHNEEEHLLYQEEEFKRLQYALSNKEYGQVSYQYTEDSQNAASSEEIPQNEDFEPFVPSPFLDIPQNMVLPSNKKENQIIEKTATYIAQHGPQVEIIVKTREAKNEKLGFMQSGHSLNPYYNFILDGIKHGRYRPGTEQKQVEVDINEGYLHPALSSSTTVESAPSIPTITYKPSSGSSYDLLVKKISNVQQTSDIHTLPSKKKSPTTTKISHNLTKTLPPQKETVALPPSNIREIIAKLINFSQTIGLHPSKLAPNLLKTDSKNMEFLLPEHPYHAYYQEQLVVSSKKEEKSKVSRTQSLDDTNVYDPENPTDDTETLSVNYDTTNKIQEKTEDDITLGCDNNNAESVSSEEHDNSHDEKESHVSTNSPENSKSMTPPPHQSTTTTYDVPNQPTHKPTPVCFSIKKPKEEKLDIPSALPFEETLSEEEDEENKEKEKVVKNKTISNKILMENTKSAEKPTTVTDGQSERKDKSYQKTDKKKVFKISGHKSSKDRSRHQSKSSPSTSTNISESKSRKSKHRSRKHSRIEKPPRNERKSQKSDTVKPDEDCEMPITPPVHHSTPPLSPPPKEIDKVKKEERKKKAKVLVDRLKKEESNKKATVLIEKFKSCLNDLVEETCSEEPKNVEEHLRKKVKKSLQELAQKIVASPSPQQNSTEDISPYTRVELNADILKKTNFTVKSVKLRHKPKKSRLKYDSSDDSSSSSSSSKTSSDSEEDSSSDSTSSSISNSRKRKSSHRKHGKHSHKKRKKLSHNLKKSKSHKHSKKSQSHRKRKRRYRSESSS